MKPPFTPEAPSVFGRSQIFYVVKSAAERRELAALQRLDSYHLSEMSDLDPNRLRTFMKLFYGYGSWDAKLWFVGMEEGGGDSLDEIERRLAAWDGSDDLADLREFHRAIGVDRWFRQRPQIQNTWGKLIRIALAAAGRPTDAESVRNYQRDELGRRNGDTAVIELFPLPSPSTREWLYGETMVTEIATRESYVEALAPHRIGDLRRRILCQQPKAVVFYGSVFRRYWAEVAGIEMRPIDDAGFEAAKSASTVYIVTPHPVSRGVTTRHFEKIGQFLRAEVA